MDELKKKVEKQNIDEFERQLERFGFFTHTGLSTQAERINEIESFLYGLIDTLIMGGKLDQQELQKVVAKVRDETLRKKEHLHGGIALRVDSNEKKMVDGPYVNCEERLHICKAVCCQLNFTLSVEELESRKIKWDFGRPYFIRQDEENYCCHIDKAELNCTIYEDRPRVCHKYSCVNDKRIWNDFEKMELNEEWISQNIGQQKVQLQGVFMIPGDEITYKPKS